MSSLDIALRETFTKDELEQLHAEALRELGTATDDELWGRLVDVLFTAATTWSPQRQEQTP